MTATTPDAAPPLAPRPPLPGLDVLGESLRVIVVDDHPLYRQGIVRALEAAGIAVVAEAGDGGSALDLIRLHEPDVAVLDVSMPVLDGIDVVAALARRGSTVPVVLLSAFDDDPLITAAIEAGAASYVNKTADRDDILRVIAGAATPAQSPVALSGRSGLAPGDRHGWIPRLTLREVELLMLARDGTTKAEMARQLAIDEPAVRRGLSSAITKIGADTLPEALDVASRAGVLA